MKQKLSSKSPSTKARILRHARRDVDKLTTRLGTCSLDDHAKVFASLQTAKASLKTLEETLS